MLAFSLRLKKEFYRNIECNIYNRKKFHWSALFLRHIQKWQKYKQQLYLLKKQKNDMQIFKDKQQSHSVHKH